MEDLQQLLKIIYDSFAGQNEIYFFDITISKNKTSKKYVYYCAGIDGDRPCHMEESFNSLEEAFQHLNSIAQFLVFFEIKYIEPSFKNIYSKIVIDQLNSYKKKPIEKKYLEELNSKLDVNLNYIEGADKKNIRIIKLTNQKTNWEKNIVGKLDFLGNSIIIKNENDEIVSVFPSENLLVTTQKIESENYWYYS